jgi:triosephosphate isomerase
VKRRRICAGNWKMHKTGAETAAFFEAFLPLARELPNQVEIVVCPPFTALASGTSVLRQAQDDERTRIKLGAQNVHWAASGAYTGEISAAMLLEFGVEYVIVGHSERRQYFGETDEQVRMRTAAALQAGITPIVAVGETLDIRQAGNAEPHVVAQIRAALTGLDVTALQNIAIAYEPVWAIGTGQNCDPSAADAIMGAIRSSMEGLEDTPILYGGSVKPENIAQYCRMPQIDGALVGGASLEPQSFAAIAKGVCVP